MKVRVRIEKAGGHRIAKLDGRCAVRELRRRGRGERKAVCRRAGNVPSSANAVRRDPPQHMVGPKTEAVHGANSQGADLGDERQGMGARMSERRK